ncbi:GTP-binding protein [Paracoccus sp. APAP_BH8]
MAKAKFERTKPHVNIGTIGHVDHGKTTLCNLTWREAGERERLWLTSRNHPIAAGHRLTRLADLLQHERKATAAG